VCHWATWRDPSQSPVAAHAEDELQGRLDATARSFTFLNVEHPNKIDGIMVRTSIEASAKAGRLHRPGPTPTQWERADSVADQRKIDIIGPVRNCTRPPSRARKSWPVFSAQGSYSYGEGLIARKTATLPTSRFDDMEGPDYRRFQVGNRLMSSRSTDSGKFQGIKIYELTADIMRDVGGWVVSPPAFGDRPILAYQTRQGGSGRALSMSYESQIKGRCRHAVRLEPKGAFSPPSMMDLAR